MVRLEGPVLPDDGVAEVTHFLQHGVHESGSQLRGVILLVLALVSLDVLCRPTVVVERWAGV